MRSDPPIRTYHSAVAPPTSLISSLIAPMTSPNPVIATAQPSQALRCSRQASPNGLTSWDDASARPRRAATMPLPTSRRVASMAALPTRTTKATANKASGAQSSPPKARICWPQPTGDSQAGQALTRRTPLASTLPSMLPMPLTTTAAPSTLAASELAPRLVDDNWTVTAATAAKTIPSAPIAAPAVSELAVGCPVASPASPAATTKTTLAATETIRAAARPACRPTAAAPTSSARPVSSFWRVWRTTVKALISAAKIPSRK